MKNNKKGIIIGLVVIIILVAVLVSQFVFKNEPSTMILSTTTSTQDSGLLDVILPEFTKETGIEVKVIAVGTGKALQMGMDGEADVLLVHAKSSEEEFVANGHGAERFDVMYNDFILVGPKDSKELEEISSKSTVSDMFKWMMESNIPFVSRGDDSGTHKKELSIWALSEISPSGDWYISAGKGMGDVLLMANEMQAFTLTDRATYLSMKDKLDLDIVPIVDESLKNEYGVIAVDPSKNELINNKAAKAFIKWILSDDAQKMIGEYGIEEYGEALFFPNAK